MNTYTPVLPPTPAPPTYGARRHDRLTVVAISGDISIGAADITVTTAIVAISGAMPTTTHQQGDQK